MKDEFMGILIGAIICTAVAFGAYSTGKYNMEREAVKRGFAIYDNQNGSTEVGKFKWNDEAQK